MGGQIIQIIIAMLSTLFLIIGAYFIFSFSRDEQCAIFHDLFLVDADDLHLYEKALVYFLGIFLYIPFYIFSDAMLYWIPYEWGSYDDLGDFVSLRNIISFWFALGVTYWISNFIISTVRSRTSLYLQVIFERGQNDIVATKGSYKKMQMLRDSFKQRRVQLRAPRVTEYREQVRNRHRLSGLESSTYGELIHILDQKIQKKEVKKINGIQ